MRVITRSDRMGVLASQIRTLLAAALLFGASPIMANAQPNEMKPYDEKLVRLSEILGAVHYLRELCGSNDGQLCANACVTSSRARAPHRCGVPN